MATGFLHPGEMGASLAATCRGDRLWCGDGRSAVTRARATAAAMDDVGSIAALAQRADIIVSVCPPGAASDVARAVVAAGFQGIYVDANAIAPSTSRSIGARFERFVDGGVVGPPVSAPGSTRLYLSGRDADEVAALWAGSALEVRVVDGDAGAASAVKVCFAAWTKGSAALLLAIRALAAAEGVEPALLDEWSTSMPGLAEQSNRAASGNAPKAWRFEAELNEIAQSFAAHDLPDGFGLAAAEVYARMAAFKDTTDTTLDDVIEALNRAASGAAPPNPAE